jgi:hypothetical protein
MLGWLAVLLLLLAGCTYKQIVERITTPEQRAAAVRLAEAIENGDEAVLRSAMQPGLFEQSLPALRQARRLVPPGGVDWELTAASLNTLVGRSGKTVTTFYALEGNAKGRWLVTTIVTRQANGGPVLVTGWNLSPFASSPRAVHDFTLSGKSAVHYLWLALAALMPLVCIAAVVSIWRSPPFKRRRLWTLGSLVGLGLFALDWTTGSLHFRPIHVNLLSGMALRGGPYQPWTIGFGIPVFAILFLIRRKQIRKQGQEPAAEPQQGTP